MIKHVASEQVPPFVDNAVEMLHLPTVGKIAEIPEFWIFLSAPPFAEEYVQPAPVAHEAPMQVHVEEKTVEIPKWQTSDEFTEIPKIRQVWELTVEMLWTVEKIREILENPSGAVDKIVAIPEIKCVSRGPPVAEQYVQAAPVVCLVPKLQFVGKFAEGSEVPIGVQPCPVVQHVAPACEVAKACASLVLVIEHVVPAEVQVAQKTAMLLQWQTVDMPAKILQSRWACKRQVWWSASKPLPSRCRS